MTNIIKAVFKKIKKITKLDESILEINMMIKRSERNIYCGVLYGDCR